MVGIEEDFIFRNFVKVFPDETKKYYWLKKEDCVKTKNGYKTKIEFLQETFGIKKLNEMLKELIPELNDGIKNIKKEKVREAIDDLCKIAFEPVYKGEN